MSGQPDDAFLKFDVTRLEILEPVGATAPTFIVPVNGAFDLKVTFEGSKPFWQTLKLLGCGYEAHFYAEGIGVAAPDIDFGKKAGKLVVGTDVYTETMNVPLGIAVPGIYQVACLVITQHAGMAGFTDPPIILTVEAAVP